MKKITVVIFLWLFQYSSFSQSRAIDSLTVLLKTAKTDIAQLNLYFELIDLCEAKDNLLYTEPALDLVNKLLAKENNEEQRMDLFNKEQALLLAVTEYYRQNDTINWKKVDQYNANRLQAIEKEGNQKRTAEFLFHLARISLDYKKDSASFFSTIQRSIDISTSIKDGLLASWGYYFIFSFSKSAGNYTKAFESSQTAIAVSRQIVYSKGVALGMSALGDLYTDYGEFDQAEKNYQSALDISYTIKDTAYIFDILSSFGNLYYKQHNTAKALEYYNKMLDLCRNQNNNPYNTGLVYKWIGKTYNDNSEYNKALIHFEKSLQLFYTTGNRLEEANVLSEIGSMYNKQQLFDTALLYHTWAVQIADSSGLHNRKPMWLHELAKDYYGLTKYEKAKLINDEALVTYKRWWFDTKNTSAIELLAMQIDSAKGDHAGALQHYKEYVALQVKLQGDEVRKQAQLEKFQSEIDRKQQEQEKKDAVAMRTRNLQYMVIGAFILLGTFLTYGYLQKNKDKKRIEKAYGELKSTQAQLIQSEKMASLGELTAGIAHEIQNPLNFVNNFSELNSELIKELKSEVVKGDMEEVNAIANDIESNSEKINHHGKRAEGIVKGMLQHSRSSSGQKEPTDINALCDEYLRLSYHGLRAKDKSFNAILKTDFDSSIGKINLVPQDMGRVIMNLLTNAFYAVNEKQKAESSKLIAYDPAVSIITKKINNKIEIMVSDNGNGIPQNIIDKIFQPFFTTKPTGQGTGLGLSLSYDIVTKGHGGELKVETKEGAGTAFIIILPA